MKKIGCLFIIILIISPTLYGKDMNLFGIEGLTCRLYYKLCGVWETIDTRDNKEREKYTWPKEFSWGWGRTISNDSMIIDFGADPPFFTPLTGEFTIDRIEELEPNKLVIEYSWREEGDFERYWNLILLFDDGTIQFQGYGENSYFGRYSHVYYRTFGPEWITEDK